LRGCSRITTSLNPGVIPNTALTTATNIALAITGIRIISPHL
jgi:hypothetical protein